MKTGTMFKKILIANRGEIACRVIRTCRKLGIETVAIFSEADVTAQHVRLADEAYPVGGPRAADSYLNIDAIITAAKKSKAEAIHPGYGFLSENAGFARAVKAAGLVFVGPDPESMERMGSKAAAKALMVEHGVPVVPGYHGVDQAPETLRKQAQQIGFPLMIKAAAGGGGKGMRIVRKLEEFDIALASAQREASSSFADQAVILERYLEHPRHIEFQVFGDQHGNIVHLNERECSAQRRYQKVLEETPSLFLDVKRRKAMGEVAVTAARAVNYVGAGTIEFIVAANGEFYFMEMNTRLQVEHPVTELTLGLDLVEWQLLVAAGQPLPLTQDQIRPQGHAVELRLYAEDPEQNFLPGSGRLERLALPPTSSNLRLDAGVVQGDTVSIFYDPMLAKIISYDANRDLALQRMREALQETFVVGPKSNIGFLERLVRHPAITNASIDTGYLDRHLDEFTNIAAEPELEALLAAVAVALLLEEQETRCQAKRSADPYSPWAIADAWRLGHRGKRIVGLNYRGARLQVAAYGTQGCYLLEYAGNSHQIKTATFDGKYLSAALDGVLLRFRIFHFGTIIEVHNGHRRASFTRHDAFAYVKTKEKTDDRILAPMPGRIVLVKVSNGEEVTEGQELVVMEAMKMEITLRAPRTAKIEAVQAQSGEFVESETVLVKLSPSTGQPGASS